MRNICHPKGFTDIVNEHYSHEYIFRISAGKLQPPSLPQCYFPLLDSLSGVYPENRPVLPFPHIMVGKHRIPVPVFIGIRWPRHIPDSGQVVRGSPSGLNSRILYLNLNQYTFVISITTEMSEHCIQK